MELLRWLTGRPYRVAARGLLPETRFPWVAVPSLQAAAFHHAYPDSLNALSYAHRVRWVAGRYPRDAEKARAELAAVDALEARHPACVIFVLTH